MSIFVLALGVSSWANAACYIGDETNATSVQADSGNGTYNCSVVSTSDGTLASVSNGVTYSIVNGKVNWTATTDSSTGYPTADVDLVSVASSSGKRCNYAYANQPAGGAMLTTSDGSTPKSVTFCADGAIIPQPPSPPPPPPELITTVGDGCVAPFTYTTPTDGTITDTFDVAIGYTKEFFTDGLEGAAICATAGSKQVECVNECVPHTPAPGTNCSPLANGEVPLECRACELDYPDPVGSNKDLKYCWYWENHVDTSTDGYFKPSPKKKSLSASIDVTTGSNCYLITIGPLYGGKMSTVYQCK